MSYACACGWTGILEVFPVSLNPNTALWEEKNIFILRDYWGNLGIVGLVRLNVFPPFKNSK